MLVKDDIQKIIKSFGLVFGDIGTSPIYTLTVIFLLLEPTIHNVMGVISLIFWTMTLLVTVEYSWLAMSLGKCGEGGTIVLREILSPILKSGKRVTFIAVLTYVGVSLLIGDGVITPAISILSAVEGIKLIPSFSGINQTYILLIASCIALVLFSVQRKGTEKVTRFFGPIMMLWFISLSISGLFSISAYPEIIKALSPHYALHFLFTHGLEGFFILSEVILCATGGEALYADMGHLGRWPIIKAWGVVFFALMINYLGQGAFLITHPEVNNVLFEMINNQVQILYIPFLLLSIMASIIASQALISGMFSVVYQGITTRIMPMFKVHYTSAEMRTQIYIPAVNWFLLLSVLCVMYIFKESSNLAAAYGLAVTGTMTITGVMMTWIFFLRKDTLKTSIAVMITMIDAVYLVSNIFKIPNGGFWSLVIASFPLITILIFTNGQKKLYTALKPVPVNDFIQDFIPAYTNAYRIRGTALFFLRQASSIPPYIMNTILCNKIIYQENILVSANILDKPFGVSGHFREDLAEGLRVFEIEIGYLEVIDIEKILSEAGIQENVIFYGLEEILTDNFLWKIYAFIKRNTPSFVQFYSLPSSKLHGIVTRVEI